jgi:hypothetical protein
VPQQAEHLSFSRGERDAVERLHLAMTLAELLDDDRIHRHRDSSRR